MVLGVKICILMHIQSIYIFILSLSQHLVCKYPAPEMHNPVVDSSAPSSAKPFPPSRLGQKTKCKEFPRKPIHLHKTAK